MHKLQLRGQLLYLNGTKQTLLKTEAHNTRNIPIELDTFGHIDPNKTHLNHEIVSLHGESLEGCVLRHISEAGIDITKGPYKRSDKGVAIEWVFSVTPGYAGDFLGLYTKCVHWLGVLHPTCPIVHAIMHVDEGDPHIHVIIVPIVGNKMPSSRILGFKGISRKRIYDLYEQVGKEYNLSFPLNLKGAVKRHASEVAIRACEKLAYRKILGPLWKPFVMSIKARPEPFLEALGIDIDPHNIPRH